jgi:polypeptide N-acetylgalactosaminyltransferase
VWLDEWKHFYFKLHPEVAAYSKNQSISDRVELRSKLKCKSFRWFLNNIWPHHFFPMEDRFFGKLRNKKANKCLQSPRSKAFGQPYGPALLSDCIVELYSPQLFVMTPEGYIKTDDSVCLDAVEFKDGSEVRIMACNTLVRQKWKIDSGMVKHIMSGKCLDLANKGEGLVVQECLDGSRSQQWTLENVEWKEFS